MESQENPNWQYRLLLIGKLATMFLLAAALLPWPMAFYTLIRWLVFPVFVFAAYVAFADDRDRWVWAFIYLAILYNPIRPFGLGRGAWSVLDLVTIALVGLSMKRSKASMATTTAAGTPPPSQPARRRGAFTTSGRGTSPYLPLPSENRFFPRRPHRRQIEVSEALGLPLAILHVRLNLPLVLIPGGVFIMGMSEIDEDRLPSLEELEKKIGGSDGDDGLGWLQGGNRLSATMERPRHTVSVQPFYLGLTPVLQFQWSALCEPSQSAAMGAMHPVDHVSWDQAHGFLAEASGNLRLSTEAEWEFSVRAFSESRYWWGDTYVLGLANLFRGDVDQKYAGETTEPGEFPPNPFGLYDMIGNIEEWCQDLWHPSYVGAPVDGSAWENLDARPWEFVWGDRFEAIMKQEAEQRVVRGTRCKDTVEIATCSRRDTWPASTSRLHLGFRVALHTRDLKMM